MPIVTGRMYLSLFSYNLQHLGSSVQDSPSVCHEQMKHHVEWSISALQRSFSSAVEKFVVLVSGSPFLCVETNAAFSSPASAGEQLRAG